MESEFTLDDQIDTICDRFEKAWKSGQDPEVVEFWEPLANDNNYRLLEELVCLDVDYRSKTGKKFSFEFYLQEFPEHELMIRRVLGEKNGGAESPTEMGVDPRETLAGDDHDPELTTQVPTVSSLKRVGPYQLLRKIGSGGMGMVYLAEQREPVRRTVAIKLMRTELDTPELLARFDVEIQALSMMNHPNIARVLDIGKTEKGTPYLAIEYVDGFSLSKYCDHRQLSIVERMGLFSQLCAAIGHAHRKGVLHRDLKPSNILVTESNGKPVVKVIDFGLARAVNPQGRLAENTLVTMPGNLLGTLEYMSPEQVEMNELGLDTRTDVYSLGAILYELLTGTTPLNSERIQNDGLHRLMIQIVEGEFQKPSDRLLEQGDRAAVIATNRQTTPQRLSRMLRKELDWVCAKALQKKRSHRYEGVAFLLNDMQNYLNGDVVTARPPTVSYQLGKTVWKHRSVFAVSALLLIIVIGGWWTTSINLDKSRRQEQKSKSAEAYSKRMENVARKEARSAQQAEIVALEREAKANENLLIAEKNGYVADMLVIQNDWENGKDIKRLSSLLDKYRMRPDLTGFEWNYWKHQTTRFTHCLMKHDYHGPSRTWGWRGAGRAAIAAVFSPDGQQLVSIGYDDTIRIWDVVRGIELRSFAAPKRVDLFDTVQFSPDGLELLCTQGNSAFVLDLASGQLVTEITAKGPSFYGAAFSSDQKEIVTAKDDLTLVFWDSRTGKKLRSSPGILPINYSGYSSAMNNSISSLFKKEPRNQIQDLRVWDIQDESWISMPLIVPATKIMASPGGYCLAIQGEKITQVNPASVRTEFKFPKGFDSEVSACATDTTGNYLAVGNSSGQICFWHVDRPAEPQLIREALKAIECLDFSPDGNRLTALESSGDLRVLDLHAKSFPQVNSSFLVKKFNLSDNRIFLVMYMQGKINVLDLKNNRQISNFNYSESSVSSVAVANSGKHVLVTHADGTVRMLDANSGKEIWNWTGLTRDLSSPEVSMNSSEEQVLIGDGKRIVILNAKDGSVVHSWQAHESDVTGLAFHPDGKRVISASVAQCFRFWDATSARQIWQKEKIRKWGNRLAFSQDGRVLALSGGPVRVLETETGREICRINTDAGFLAVNKDGSRIATKERSENEIKIWEGEAGRELLSLRDLDEFFWFEFGFDDQWFLSWCGSKTMFWHLKPLNGRQKNTD